MQKICTSLSCPFCHSSNIQSSLEFRDEKIKYDENENTKIITKNRIYNCKCNNCKRDYTIDYGIDKFILFETPCSVSEAGDVKLLATFESQSNDTSNYKICSISPSHYDENTNSIEETYLILTENDEYPIILPKQKVSEIVDSPDKINLLTKNTFLSRYR